MGLRRLFGAFVLAAAAAGCREKPAAPPPPPAAGASAAAEGDAFEVRRSRPRREIPCVGVLKAKRATRLGSQVSGRVAEVLVNEGDTVKENDVLVKLDPALFAIEVSQREADLKAAQIAKAGAELQYTRIKALWDKPEGQEPTVSRKAFDEAQIQFELAKAHVEQAEAALRKASHNLDEATIRAPYAGVVTRRFVDPGEPVTSAPVTDLVEVQETAALDLEFLLPQRDLARIRPRTAVSWDAEGVADGAGAGEIATILPDVDEATRSFRCRVTVGNAEGKLRPGMLARVRVADEGSREAIWVPVEAIEAIEGGSQLQVLENGKPVARAVRIGEYFGDLAEVAEGLSPGDSILVPRTGK